MAEKMREILFRGKDQDTAKWVYGHFYTTPYVGENGKTCDYHFISKPKTYGSNMVIPETVGQYTGMTDKNGVKIFEGDIVEVNHEAYSGVRGEVRFGWGSFMLKNVSNVLTLYGFLPWCEVVGNIHDDPELLEG